MPGRFSLSSNSSEGRQFTEEDPPPPPFFFLQCRSILGRNSWYTQALLWKHTRTCLKGFEPLCRQLRFWHCSMTTKIHTFVPSDKGSRTLAWSQYKKVFMGYWGKKPAFPLKTHGAQLCSNGVTNVGFHLFIPVHPQTLAWRSSLNSRLHLVQCDCKKWAFFYQGGENLG